MRRINFLIFILTQISCNENLSLTDVESTELKISVKVFIPQANKKALCEALEQGFQLFFVASSFLVWLKNYHQILIDESLSFLQF